MRLVPALMITMVLAGQTLAQGQTRGSGLPSGGPVEGLPTRGDPSPRARALAAQQKEFLIEYRRVKNGATSFSKTWQKWITVRKQIAAAKTLDAKLFRKEAKLWKGVVEQIEKLDRQRPAKGYVDPEPKR